MPQQRSLVIARVTVRHARPALACAAAGGLRGCGAHRLRRGPAVPAAGLLPREAREHEPARALLGGPDGLDHVRALLHQAPPWLAPPARVLLELNARRYPAPATSAERAGFQVRRHDSKDGQTTVMDLTVPARHLDGVDNREWTRPVCQPTVVA